MDRDRNGTLSRRDMLDYGAGYIGQSVTYNLMSVYFVVFMTNCVGFSTTWASFIMSTALLVEMAAGMVIGNLSDNCTSSMGKRRPFVLFSILTLPVVILLLFRTVDPDSAWAAGYYLILSIAFRVAFSSFEIPYSALGAEIVADYDGRTKLRTNTRIFSIIGNGLAYMLPLWILDLLPERTSLAWWLSGMVTALLFAITATYAFLRTKKHVRPYDLSHGTADGAKEGKDRLRHKHRSEARTEMQHENPQNVFAGIVKNYGELLHLRVMRILVVYKAAFAVGYAIYNVATIYYLSYYVGLGNRVTSYLYLFSIVIFALSTPLVNAMAVKIGKANQQKYMFLLSGLVGLLVFLLAGDSVLGAALYIFAFALLQTSFWQLSTSIFYDVAEVDEFVNGKRREGDILSFVSILGSMISALVVQLFGIAFDLSGFDPVLSIQPGSALLFLRIAYVLVPAICYLIGYLAIRALPINKKTFASLVAAVERKRNGEPYDEYMEDVQKIL